MSVTLPTPIQGGHPSHWQFFLFAHLSKYSSRLLPSPSLSPVLLCGSPTEGSQVSPQLLWPRVGSLRSTRQTNAPPPEEASVARTTADAQGLGRFPACREARAGYQCSGLDWTTSRRSAVSPRLLFAVPSSVLSFGGCFSGTLDAGVASQFTKRSLLGTGPRRLTSFVTSYILSREVEEGMGSSM